MVEPVKFPKYLTVRSTPPPEVDLSSDLYSEQTESEDQLKWLVAGSVGGGAINPDDENFCLLSTALLGSSIMNNFILFRDLMNWKNFGFDSDQFKKNIEQLIQSEFIVLAASIYAEVVALSKVQPPTELKSFLLFLSNRRPFPLKISAILHLEIWTPYGIVRGIPRTWNACGRPGGGLGEKIAEKIKAPLPTAQEPATAPSTFTAIDPKAATEALTATAIVGVFGVVVGAAILYILTLPESVAASIALPALQADEEDCSM
ncbi:MAG: hypothetical protein A3H42_03920 [Deltaproteobacteria bacterium RIFCSPLOWO2_02_FULL_46_8]|nr:MAG: hypothetical protein A3H42_03920 [Deltaproteobacteria bacterium RIFCSPLOWO2_02_FULL_46_8]